MNCDQLRLASWVSHDKVTRSDGNVRTVKLPTPPHSRCKGMVSISCCACQPTTPRANPTSPIHTPWYDGEIAIFKPTLAGDGCGNNNTNRLKEPRVVSPSGIRGTYRYWATVGAKIPVPCVTLHRALRMVWLVCYGFSMTTTREVVVVLWLKSSPP